MSYNRCRGDLRAKLYRVRNNRNLQHRQTNHFNININPGYDEGIPDFDVGEFGGGDPNQSGYWENCGGDDWDCNNGNNMGSRRNGAPSYHPMANINVRVNNNSCDNGGGRQIIFNDPPQNEMNNMALNNNSGAFCHPNDRFDFPGPQIHSNNMNTPRCLPDDRFNYPEPQMPNMNTPRCLPDERFNYPDPQMPPKNNSGFIGTPQCPANDRFNYPEPQYCNNNIPLIDDGIFTRRNNRPPATPQRPFQANEFAVVYDYNHQQTRIPANSPSRRQMAKEMSNTTNNTPPNPKRVLPPRDPRIEKLLNSEKANISIKTEVVLPCESATTKPAVACSHPKPNLLIKPEPVDASSSRPVPRNGEIASASSSGKKIDPMLLDRIEREKYEKAKLRKTIVNPTKGERAVDCIRAIPRPPKDPEMEDEINVVIEKLNVPVITTPANFTNYKIPRATSKDDSITEPDTTTAITTVEDSNNKVQKIAIPAPKVIVTSSTPSATKPKESSSNINRANEKEKGNSINKSVTDKIIIKTVNKPAEKTAEPTKVVKPESSEKADKPVRKERTSSPVSTNKTSSVSSEPAEKTAEPTKIVQTEPSEKVDKPVRKERTSSPVSTNKTSSVSSEKSNKTSGIITSEKSNKASSSVSSEKSNKTSGSITSAKPNKNCGSIASESTRTTIRRSKEASPRRMSIENSHKARDKIIKERLKNLFDSDSDSGTQHPKAMVKKPADEGRPRARSRERRDSVSNEKRSISVSEHKQKKGEERKSCHSSHSREKPRDESAVKSSRHSGAEKKPSSYKTSDESEGSERKSRTKDAPDTKNKSKDDKRRTSNDNRASKIKKNRHSVIELTDSDGNNPLVKEKSKDESSDGIKNSDKGYHVVKDTSIEKAQVVKEKRRSTEDIESLTIERLRLMRELEKENTPAMDSDVDKRSTSKSSSVKKHGKHTDGASKVRRSRSTVSEKISSDSDTAKPEKPQKVLSRPDKMKRIRVITDSSDEDEPVIVGSPAAAKEIPAVEKDDAKLEEKTANSMTKDVQIQILPLPSGVGIPIPLVNNVEESRQQLLAFLFPKCNAEKIRKLQELMAEDDVPPSVDKVSATEADSLVEASSQATSHAAPQTKPIIKDMPQPQSPTISSCEGVDRRPSSTESLNEISDHNSPPRSKSRKKRIAKDAAKENSNDGERVTSSPRRTRRALDDLATTSKPPKPVSANKPASRTAGGRSGSVSAVTFNSQRGRNPTQSNRVSSPVVAESPKFQMEPLRVTSPSVSSPRKSKKHGGASPIVPSPRTSTRDPRLMSPSLDRESPKTIKKRNKKNELEKLQEDINRNFALIDMMSSSVRTATKEAAVKPKKVIQRRKSMCASMSEENGSLKMKITLEPVKAKPILHRRLSMGAAFSAAYVKLSDIEDDIRNDDPFYDLTSGNCRLCTKTSPDMGRHYIQYHPKSEVYCCRINYATAKKLLAGESLNVLVNGDSLQFDCILCGTVQSCATYYDIYHHLVNHTGEFYYKCLQCDFREVTIDKDHGKKHKFEICPFPDVDKKRILGHMCDKCHYVQLHKSNITKHIMMQHRGELQKPNCKEIVLLDFSDHNICTIDFEDLDDKFMEMSVIVPPEENWANFEDVFRDYMNGSPITDREVTSTVWPVANNNDASCTFEHDVYQMMALAPPEPQPTSEPRLGLRIDNLKYNRVTGIFQYASSKGLYKNSDYNKMLDYLTDLSELGEEWSGACHECDENGVYMDPHPVHMEFLHLRNVHWYRMMDQTTEPTPQQTRNTKNNILQPWLSKENKKSKACSERMLSISAILSRFKCMAVDCHFFTNSIDSMAAHLDEHDEDPLAEEDYVIECPYCEASTTNPSDYFNHVVTDHGTSQYFCPYCFYRSGGGNVLYHLQVYHPERNPFMYDGKFDGVFVEKDEKTKEEIREENDVIYHQLQNNVQTYRCPECNDQFYPLDMFQRHMEEHGRGYFCQQCNINVPAGHFMPHISKHNQGPFDCIYCPYGAKHGQLMKRHIADHHPWEMPYVCVRFVSAEVVDCNDVESIRLCLVADRHADPKYVKLVPKEVFDELRERPAPDSRSATPKKQVEEVAVAISENTFEEFIEKLPSSFIFDKPISCPNCNYSNSVRKNLLRHLELHSANPLLDQENDPVNRHDEVVALVKSNQVAPKRALFDANLAANSVAPIKRRRMTISELSGGDMEAPQYVPMAQRFYCGVRGCIYKALEERMLKLHIDTIHAKETYFKCPHCAKELNDAEYDLDAIAMHYRLHDNQLFKCGKCAFFADTRHNMSNHIRKRHNHGMNEEDIQVVRSTQPAKLPPPKPTKTAMMRRNSVAGPQQPKKKARRDVADRVQYRCSYCPHTGTLLCDMKQHALEEHNYKGQFECGDCGTIAASYKGFKIHAAHKHRGNNPQPTMITHFKFVTGNSSDEDDEEEEEHKGDEKEKAPEDVAMEGEAEERETNIRREVIVHENSNPFKNSKYFLKHFKAHPVNRPIAYYCEICPSTFSQWETIESHYRQQHGTTQFNPKLPSFLLFDCGFCKFVTAESRALVNHYYIHHNNLPPIYRVEYLVKCVKCEFSSTAEKVAQHCAESHKGALAMVRSSEEAQTCGMCRYLYDGEQDLQQHFRQMHPNGLSNPTVRIHEKLMKRLLNVKVDKKFRCGVCKVVLNKYQYRFHDHAKQCMPIEMAHRYPCRMCSHITLDYEEAKTHLGAHKEAHVACERCNLSFSTYDVLMMHITEHRHVGEYMARLMKQFSIEIVFPNGLTTLESVAAATLAAKDYKRTAAAAADRGGV